MATECLAGSNAIRRMASSQKTAAVTEIRNAAECRLEFVRKRRQIQAKGAAMARAMIDNAFRIQSRLFQCLIQQSQTTCHSRAGIENVSVFNSEKDISFQPDFFQKLFMPCLSCGEIFLRLIWRKMINQSGAINSKVIFRT